MRIATWNLESARTISNDRLLAFQAVMAGVDAELWVLTETWQDVGPGDGYRKVAVTTEAGDLKIASKRRWVAIWAKDTIAAEPVEVLDQADRLACVRVSRTNRRPFMVFGTVLPW